MLFIPVILGSGREGRESEHAAAFMLAQVKAEGIETELIDVRDFPSPFTARVEEEGWEDRGLADKMTRSDGFIIVSPEYNHGYPGELKIFIDHFYAEYGRKAVGLVGVSNGPWGGTRVIEQLRGVMGALDVAVTKRTVMFTHAPKLFGEDGLMSEEDTVSYGKNAKGMIGSVAWFAAALKEARKASS